MRTISKKYRVYKYEELEDSAKEKAYTDWLQRYTYGWGSENIDTLHAFTELFNIEVTNWSYDSNNYSYRLTIDNEDIQYIEGVRLIKYLMNNFYDSLSQSKEYKITKKDGKIIKRVSRINRTFDLGHTELTGYCIDYNILKPLFMFLTKWDSNSKYTTYEDLMDECISAFFNACVKDCEWCESEEHFKEMCECNDWEFHEDGTME